VSAAALAQLRDRVDELERQRAQDCEDFADSLRCIIRALAGINPGTIPAGPPRLQVITGGRS